MISQKRAFLFLSLIIPTLAGLHADTVVLKTGETLNGKILEQTPEAVTIEYMVSSSISDQRSIPVAEIEKIQKVQPDEVAFASIQGYKLDPEWSMQPDNYERMSQALNDFLLRYANSPHAAEVQKNLADITAEKARVQNGELKLFGNWLTKEQASKQQSQVQAQTAFSTMRDLAMRGDLIGALNLFEVIKKSCRTALVYPGAVQLAASLLPSLQRQVAVQRQEIAREEENWKSTIAMTSEPKKTQLVASRAQIAAHADAAMAAALKSGAKWTPIIPHSLASLDAIDRTISVEKSNLAAIPVARMRQSMDRANKATDAIAAKDAATAEDYLREAQTLWPENGALEYVKAELTELQVPATPVPTPTPAPVKVVAKATPKPVATPVAVAETAPEIKESVPFYMTPKGAAIIVVSLLVLIGLGSFVARLLNKPNESAEA